MRLTRRKIRPVGINGKPEAGKAQDRIVTTVEAVEAAGGAVHALEEQQGGELPPGEVLGAVERNAGAADAETIPVDELFEREFGDQVGIEPVVDERQGTGMDEMVVVLLAGTCTGDRAGLDGEAVEVLPADAGGELPEDGVEQEAVGEDAREVAAVLAPRIQVRGGGRRRAGR